jgi:phage repressor protein C with HTH and peptisase S24 domain
MGQLMGHLGTTGVPVLVGDLRPGSVQAGFPSPAEDQMVQRVDLLAELIKHPEASFLLRIRGKSMTGVGIFDGDVVLVDHTTHKIRRSGIDAPEKHNLFVKRPSSSCLHGCIRRMSVSFTTRRTDTVKS